MDHGIVYAGTQSTLPITNFKLEPCSYLSLNSHLRKLSFSLKTQSGSFRTRSIKASVHSLCATTESFYDLLGIPASVTCLEIKQAYKRLVLKCHPDVSPPERVEENTKRFIQVQEAYETLSDPGRRALYDREMAKGLVTAITVRNPYLYKQGLAETGEWRKNWESQLRELKRRKMNKDSRNGISWGARMRRQRCERADDCGFYHI